MSQWDTRSGDDALIAGELPTNSLYQAIQLARRLSTRG